MDVEITILCEAIKRGCTFSARMYDRQTEKFYSGQGATATEAAAWCFDDYVARVIMSLPHRMAQPTTEKPFDRFRAWESGVRDTTSGKIVPRDGDDFLVVTRLAGVPALVTPVVVAVGCFDSQIPRREEVATATPNVAVSSAATRRNTVKKKQKDPK